MSVVSPYRVTDEDLPDLDAKTREGIAPLLDSLNTVVPQLVDATHALPTEQLIEMTLVTEAAVADSFPLVFKHSVPKPRWVGMVCNPKDQSHSLATPFVMQGFQLTDAGLVSIPNITGLLPDNTYSLTFLIK